MMTLSVVVIVLLVAAATIIYYLYRTLKQTREKITLMKTELEQLHRDKKFRDHIITRMEEVMCEGNRKKKLQTGTPSDRARAGVDILRELASKNRDK